MRGESIAMAFDPRGMMDASREVGDAFDREPHRISKPFKAAAADESKSSTR